MPERAENPELSIVIPAFNEEQRLAPTLGRIFEYLVARNIASEVLVVDDGSRDGTSRVAAGFEAVRVLRLDRNRGKGAAVREGVLASHGRRVLLTDADLSTPITELDRLEPRLAECQLVLGSRAVAGARITRRQPLYRELMGKTFNRLIALLGVRGLRDTQCGFKLLDGDVARQIFAHLITPGFAFDVEMAWLARRLGYGIAEVGVEWENSPTSRVDPLTDPPRMILEILRFRWHHRGMSLVRTR